MMGNEETPFPSGDGEDEEYDVFGHAALGMDDDGQEVAANDHVRVGPPSGTVAVPVPAESNNTS